MVIKSRAKPQPEEKPASLFFDRYPHVILAAIFLLALILRVLALLSLKESVYFDFLLWDERVYHHWAMKIANGIPVASTYGFAPFPAYIMAFVYKWISPDILYIRLLNIIFGALTCWMVFLIGKEMAGRKVGLIACLIASLYEPFIFYSIVPLKTSLSVFLFAITVFLFLTILNNASIFKAIILGIVIGLMLNVRPNSLVIIPVIALIIIWVYYRYGFSLKRLSATILLYAMGICLAVAPFIIIKYQASGEFRLTTGQSGYAFFLGNNLDNPDPYFRPVPFASPSPFEQGAQMIIEASRRAGKRLSSREASHYWTHEVMKKAREQPAAFMWKICQKTLVLFNRFEAGDHYHIGFLSHFVRFFKIPFVSFWLILPFGMAGMVTAGFRSMKFCGITLIFIFYASTLVLFYTSTRFRLPLLIILIPFAVTGLRDLFSNVKYRRLKNVATYSVILILFFIIEFLPVQATDDMTPYYNTHAVILQSKGFEDEAIQYWEEASRMNTQVSSYVNVSLAGKYYMKQDIRKYLYYLEKIPDNSFAAAYKYEMIGDIMFNQGDIEKAISAYSKSLNINSGRREVREKLINLYWRTDRKKALKEYEQLQYILSFYKGANTTSDFSPP